MSGDAAGKTRALKEQQERRDRRRQQVLTLGAMTENDFEMLAVMATAAGFITRSRAAEILGVRVDEYRRDIAPPWEDHLKSEYGESFLNALAALKATP